MMKFKKDNINGVRVCTLCKKTFKENQVVEIGKKKYACPSCFAILQMIGGN